MIEIVLVVACNAQLLLRVLYRVRWSHSRKKIGW